MTHEQWFDGLPVSQLDAETATTTFGPMKKYVAANDNVRGWVGESGTAIDARPFKVRTIHIASCPADSGQPPRRGDWMQTYSGRKFWPMDPRAEEVHIEDIAHSLAMQCRYAGHCVRFYSVAEHSVLMARHLAPKHGPYVALWALLHDASEAYLIDVPRPVKPYLAGYREAEAEVMREICRRFRLCYDMPEAVHDADERIIADELVNMRPMAWHRLHQNPLGVELGLWNPDVAETEFLAEYVRLERMLGWA